MDRFFVDPTQITGSTVTFSPSQASQLARVLRLRVGARVLVLDNRGSCHEVELIQLTSNATTGKILTTNAADGEPKTQIILYQALLKGPKWEYVLQKGTEVGISAFVPLITQRCVALYEPDRWAERASRWEAILREAAEQSGRGRIPALGSPIEWKPAMQSAKDQRLLLHPGGGSLRAALITTGEPTTLSLYVGPEGGFSDDEIKQASSAGIQVVSLGKRTLRAETAGIVAASAISYVLGEMG